MRIKQLFINLCIKILISVNTLKSKFLKSLVFWFFNWYKKLAFLCEHNGWRIRPNNKVYFSQFMKEETENLEVTLIEEIKLSHRHLGKNNLCMLLLPSFLGSYTSKWGQNWKVENKFVYFFSKNFFGNKLGFYIVLK